MAGALASHDAAMTEQEKAGMIRKLKTAEEAATKKGRGSRERGITKGNTIHIYIFISFENEKEAEI